MRNLDIADLRLEVQAEFAKIVQSFQEDLAEPTMTKAVAMKWTTLPDEQKEAVKEKLPKTYQQIMKAIQS